MIKCVCVDNQRWILC